MGVSWGCRKACHFRRGVCYFEALCDEEGVFVAFTFEEGIRSDGCGETNVIWC